MIWSVFAGFALGIATSIALHYLYRPSSHAEVTDMLTSLQARITAVKQLEGLVTVQQLGKVVVRIEAIETALAERPTGDIDDPLAVLRQYQELATLFEGGPANEHDNE